MQKRAEGSGARDGEETRGRAVPRLFFRAKRLAVSSIVALFVKGLCGCGAAASYPCATNTNWGGLPNEEIRPGRFFLPAAGAFVFARAAARVRLLRAVNLAAQCCIGGYSRYVENTVRTLPGMRTLFAGLRASVYEK